MKKATTVKPILLRLKPEQDRKLLAIAEAEGCTRTEVIRVAIDRHLANYSFEAQP